MDLLIAAGVAIIGIYLIVKFFSLSFGLVYNGIVGVVMLWVLNLIGGNFAFQLPINFVTAMIAGFFGVPGIICLIAYQLLMANQ